MNTRVARVEGSYAHVLNYKKDGAVFESSFEVPGARARAGRAGGGRAWLPHTAAPTMLLQCLQSDTHYPPILDTAPLPVVGGPDPRWRGLRYDDGLPTALALHRAPDRDRERRKYAALYFAIGSLTSARAASSGGGDDPVVCGMCGRGGAWRYIQFPIWMALVFSRGNNKRPGRFVFCRMATPRHQRPSQRRAVLASAVLTSAGRVLAVLHPPRAPELFEAFLRATKKTPSRIYLERTLLFW